MAAQEQPVVVKTYFFTSNAHIAVAALKEGGIHSAVVGDQLATSLSWLGASMRATEVVVKAKDLDRAREILATAKIEEVEPKKNHDPTSAESQDNWRCPNCSAENDLQFEVCWSCLKVRTDDAKPVSSGHDPSDKIHDSATPEPAVSSPYRPPASPRIPEETILENPRLQKLRERSKKAMILGVAIPPLFLYGLALYVESRGGNPEPLKVAARIVLALIIAWCLSLMFW